MPIDKAANNVAFICKRFYAAVLLKEMGLRGKNNPTYMLCRESQDKIIKSLEKNLKTDFKIKVSSDMKSLPTA